MRPSEEFVASHVREAGFLVAEWGRAGLSEAWNNALSKSDWPLVRHTPDLGMWLPDQDPVRPYGLEVKSPKDPRKNPYSVTINEDAATAYMDWHRLLHGRLVIACVFGDGVQTPLLVGGITAPQVLACWLHHDGYYVVNRSPDTKPWPTLLQAVPA